jgi:hypothetical protein
VIYMRWLVEASGAFWGSWEVEGKVESEERG